MIRLRYSALHDNAILKHCGETKFMFVFIKLMQISRWLREWFVIFYVNKRKSYHDKLFILQIFYNFAKSFHLLVLYITFACILSFVEKISFYLSFYCRQGLHELSTMYKFKTKSVMHIRGEEKFIFWNSANLFSRIASDYAKSNECV